MLYKVVLAQGVLAAPPAESGESVEGRTMKHKYTVESRDGQIDCGHNHQTVEAAIKCRSKLLDDARFYEAIILRDGVRANGIGLWADGEPNY
jgi:hypothetical protein